MASDSGLHKMRPSNVRQGTSNAGLDADSFFGLVLGSRKLMRSARPRRLRASRCGFVRASEAVIERACSCADETCRRWGTARSILGK